MQIVGPASGRGQRDAAREMLALIYKWFTEGFDTHDLKHSGRVVVMHLPTENRLNHLEAMAASRSQRPPLGELDGALDRPLLADTVEKLAFCRR